MADFTMLSLRLHAHIPYEGIENPPFSGIPSPEQALALMPRGIPAEGEKAAEPGIAGLPEGDEELFVFEEADLIDFDPDDGPHVSLPLPPPAFYGRFRQVKGKAAPREELEGKGHELGPGLYIFMQFRPRDEEELRAGIEWFARESWWEAAEVRGPYLIRRVAEDGKLATQILRAL